MLELGAAGMKKTESAPARRQGRPPTMENARERILDVAAELFARDGYEKASLGNLADSVGITKAAIYHYYPNKKEIYEAIAYSNETGQEFRSLTGRLFQRYTGRGSEAKPDGRNVSGSWFINVGVYRLGQA
ncbi:TetR/AcrR family transcriptional regulator [Rhizobium sp. LjRoot30]|uniref:TetR/AcrR family transcriptional regulator n=1 Tax=Rhizobium sp. LjRoot30 TaxID=3342320 RepID=UPI003ECC7FAF